ncbi:MAG: ligase-associated DNA damage response exonuclease [Pseudomonadota bacterium]
MRAQDLLTLTDAGLYCPAGGFHIDPVRAVERAVVTHAHGDHCRPGHEALLASAETVVIAKARYGDEAFQTTQSLAYREAIQVGDVSLSLAPAGHVLGSSQIVIEKDGLRAVVSGDYKRREDPSCAPFEIVPCDLFVTEATFGLPVFRHPPVGGEIAKLLRSLETFPERAHAVGAYALGKAQRLIMELRRAGYDRPIWLHGALVKLCETYRTLGLDLGETLYATAAEGADTKGGIVLAPPSALADTWCRRLPDPVIGAASGWMRVRQRAKQRGVELAMVISDHADWDELCTTIRETGAEEVWVTHGAEDALCHWCSTQGILARPLSIAGRGDED